ncbi:MAG: PSD1 and planctomycete cytochrome C domain-containing protein [Saprospiraceae bacterium]
MKIKSLFLLFQPKSLLLAVSMVVVGIMQSCTGDSEEKIPSTVDFNLHIRPILADRCFKCHGPDANKREAQLRLDIPDSAYAPLKESKGKFAIVPGDLQASEMYVRMTSQDTSIQMPPPESNLKLSAREIKLFKKWIEQGAVYKQHWAFIAPQPQPVPQTKNSTWPINEIDHFVLNKMVDKKLKPNKEADKERLLKRLSFDLIGLPPSLEQQDRFVQDQAPDAYDKIVDELLANKHYGEKMAIAWLDVARYADSHGYQDDGLRTMWPWRDWVIHAFNENYPYDKFVTWQLAGDLIPDHTKEMELATGFNRNHKITQEGGIIDEEYRLEYVTDRTNTFAKTFLALTMECAKCHDHKYDPIAQKDYYSTFAFFNQVNEKGLVGDISLASLADPPYMSITTEDVNKMMQFINKKDTSPVRVMVMRDSSVERPTYILKRGVYDQPGDLVHKNTPPKVFPFDTTRLPRNRLGLAEWLFDKKHPLTARVFVNRMWQEIFGRGLVRTSGDFGMQGELPSHPELLDWLALDFMDHGWDIKRLVKQIVTSATYRQSSEVMPEKYAIDPENIYLSSAHRTRLQAELLKDHILASSGLLYDAIGGPSVKPYQPKGIWESATSGRGQLAAYVQDHGQLLYRRGMYNFIKRTAPPPSMLTFDGSNRDQCEVRRVITNTPLQALVLLNDPQVLEASRVFAEKLLTDSQDTREILVKAFRTIVCRQPDQTEQDILTGFFTEEKLKFEHNPEKATQLLAIGEYKKAMGEDKPTAAALMQTIHMIYNLEEAVTKT